MNVIYNDVIKYLVSIQEIVVILLGGSRSLHSHCGNSDFDLFCIVQTDSFTAFRETFSEKLEQLNTIQFVAELGYLENWGYLFKALTKSFLFDIASIPLERINEISIRSTNIIVCDKLGIISSTIREADDNSYDVSFLENKKRRDYSRLFAFEWIRLERSVKDNDYWLAEKSLSRLKTYFMHSYRLKQELFSNVQHCPEKHFELDFPEIKLRDLILIDGTWPTLITSGEVLIRLFIENGLDEHGIVETIIS